MPLEVFYLYSYKGTMLSKFHHNCILTGDIDYFCLLCENTFKTDKNVKDHIEKPVHKKKIDNHPFMKEYPEEYIRKLVNGYYCGLCNKLISTAIKVSLHVSDESHIANKKKTSLDDGKSNQFLKRTDDKIIAFDDLLINENAWNAFHENTCLLCNEEFNNTEDENIHKWTKGHTLNLINIKVEPTIDKALCRKIDDKVIQCLTCHVFFTSYKFSNHFSSIKHMELYQNSRKAKQNIDKNKSISNSETDNIVILKENDKREMTKNREPKETGTKSKESKNLAANKKTVENTNDKYDICKKLGIKDYIFYQDSTILCLLCDFVLEANTVDSHVESTHHLSILKLQTKWIERKKLEAKENKNSESTTFLVANETASKGNIKDKEIEYTFVKVPKMCTKTQPDQNRNDILNSVSDFQKGDVEIDFTFDKAFCKKCIKALDFDWDEIVNHIKNHNQKKSLNSSAQNINFKKPLNNESDLTTTLFTSPVIKSPTNEAIGNNEVKAAEKQDKDENLSACSLKENPKEYAELNDITYNKANSTAYCRICKKNVPNSLHSMKEHVNGSKHKKQTEIKSKLTKIFTEKKSPYETQLMAEFMDSVQFFTIFSQKYIILNEKFCLSLISYMVCTPIGRYLRCHVCDESFDVSLFLLHIDRENHELLNLPVIFSLPDEYVREVKPGIFHCGICNFIEGSWEFLQNHLMSDNHKRNRIINSRNIQEFKAKLQEQFLISFLQNMSRFNYFHNDSDSD